MSLLSRAQPVIDTAKQELPAIQNAVKQLVDVVKSIWKSVVDSGLLQSIIEKVKAIFGSASNAIESLPETIHQTTESRAADSGSVSELVGNAVDNLQEKGDAAKDMLSNAAADAKKSMQAAETTPLLKTDQGKS